MNPNDYTVACYYYPNYHVDPRNEKRHGKGWTEWELVKKSVSRFDGHFQPQQPLWGYADESNPNVMAKKIDAAADHNVNVFIFDWYWYNDGPFLHRCLEEGFLRAKNNYRLKFAIMWANHDWIDIHPAQYKKQPDLLYPGEVSESTFDFMTDHIVEKYFKHPGYWKIDGCPYFSIYELFRFIKGFGSLKAASKALTRFRDKARSAGFPDIHFNAITWGVQILPNERSVSNLSDIINALELSSTTSYVWTHHVELSSFPTTEYNLVLEKAIQYWFTASQKYDIPYHPNVTVGWDSSARTVPSAPFENVGYPYMAVISGNTPTLFQEALKRVKCFLDSQTNGDRIFTINSWNEWTEGSYLEPDNINGMDFLKAIKQVFSHKTINKIKLQDRTAEKTVAEYSYMKQAKK